MDIPCPVIGRRSTTNARVARSVIHGKGRGYGYVSSADDIVIDPDAKKPRTMPGLLS
jgi:hypothetical protein